MCLEKTALNRERLRRAIGPVDQPGHDLAQRRDMILRLLDLGGPGDAEPSQCIA